ncbi:histidine phosphatase family protein [Microbacterium betulae]|uniref:Histidine phosphatase family protein n=1 Tax=Microbacterium betulae TaxID=2981139 RepID=A0AA97FIN9_9MICO|nr:histidine phosphatase family protein [Microbacterium sp. AB]WOF22237.1 histidine phosphatase family protein [Microbacterium sp. AB]
MTTLLLVRHGATEWTLARRLQGHADVDLCDRGRQDVRALSPIVARWRPRSVVVSPLLRTRTTARLLCAPLAAPPDPVVDAAWIEHGLGEWEGLTPDAIGADYARWRAGEIVPPGAEPARAIRARVARAVGAAARLPGPVLVATHGGTIRAVLAACVGLEPSRIEPVAAPSLTVLDVAGDGSGRLRHLNVVP